MIMRAPADEDGWTHAMQRLPDASGDFVSYQPSELPYAVRWITRGADQDALGLVLPATAPPDGLAAARKNGELVWIAPGREFRTEFRFGALHSSGCENLETTITSIRGHKAAR